MAERDMLVHVFVRGRRLGGENHSSAFVVTAPDGTVLYQERDSAVRLAERLYDLEIWAESRRGQLLRISFSPPYEDEFVLTPAGNYLDESYAIPLNPALRKKFRKSFRARRNFSGLRYRRDADLSDVSLTT